MDQRKFTERHPDQVRDHPRQHRPGRDGEAVARWVHEVAAQRTDAEFELVDLLDYKLPHLDESYPASMGQYTQPHTLSWSNKIASLTAT